MRDSRQTGESVSDDDMGGAPASSRTMSDQHMDIQSGSDELLDAQSVNRHLKNAINALRDELETAEYSKDEAIQKAISI
ncbi:MAG: hypothetical protein V3V55_04940, partial [Rhodospirillales bacterium]